MEKVIAVELAKGLIQLALAYMYQAGLSEEQKDVLLTGERNRFQRNIQTPLPEV